MKAKFFMFLPVLLLLLSFAGWGVMISMATSDPTFAVEPAYYRKAALFEEELLRRSASAKLGWRVQVLGFRRTEGGHLSLDAKVFDRDGVSLPKVELAVLAISNLRASDEHAALASTDMDGRASFRLSPGAPGLWELRFTAKRGSEVFSQVIRTDLQEYGGKT